MRLERIEKQGKQYVLVPVHTFDELVEDSEMLDDIRLYDEAMKNYDPNEETYPQEFVMKLHATKKPGGRLTVWREYRKLTQSKLAAKAKIKQAYLSEIESGKKTGSVAVLKRLAKALKVDLDDLV